jgi:hypothetical protein
MKNTASLHCAAVELTRLTKKIALGEFREDRGDALD